MCTSHVSYEHLRRLNPTLEALERYWEADYTHSYEHFQRLSSLWILERYSEVDYTLTPVLLGGGRTTAVGGVALW